MGFDDFAMAEELASLVRDNLSCKHLLLSVEEALVKFLECDTSVDGVLELQPMNSYKRLIIHRLADIFGFAHESVGEGDERHLVLERCPETSMPSILVSDLLEQYDVKEESEVEALASIVRDNLPSKRLVLSVEEALVKMVECDSVDPLELEPMSSFNRHLVHRLADIFGFAHRSVGQGADRYIILKPQMLSFIPDVLVSDVLRQYDVQEPPTVSLEVKKEEDSPGPTPVIPKVELSLEERETAYLAARERIFSIGEDTSAEVKPRPQHNPVVTRRMIAHALGKQVKLEETRGQVQNDEEQLKSLGNKKRSVHSDSSSSSSPLNNPSRTESNEPTDSKNNYREEQAGAAKRMFVNALGFQPRSASSPIRSNKLT